MRHAALLQLATARPPVQGLDGRSPGIVDLQTHLYQLVVPVFAAAVTVVLVVAMVRRLRLDRPPAGEHRDAAVAAQPDVTGPLRSST